MPPDFASRLNALAEVIVQVGVNLQSGQRLLIAEPYGLQGVEPSAKPLVDAIQTAASQIGGRHSSVEVIWGNPTGLREVARNGDWREFNRLTAANARKMAHSVGTGDALLFLPGSEPALMDGIPAATIARLRQIAWEHFGPVAGQLARAATNWTAAPAPASSWADAAYPDLPADARLPALWQNVFEALRIPRLADGATDDAVANWRQHLARLEQRRDELNAAQTRLLRYQGEGTDLSVVLPAGHQWCTAQLVTPTGISFVANLPTEEIFTLPHKNSAEGAARVARPVSFGGGQIEGIQLEFRRGKVVNAEARVGGELLRQLLDTDEGAGRLGEVALVPGLCTASENSEVTPAARPTRSRTWPDSQRFFHHPLLDENTSHHIALGEGYDFCLRASDTHALNRSTIHLDLPLAAEVSFRS